MPAPRRFPADSSVAAAYPLFDYDPEQDRGWMLHFAQQDYRRASFSAVGGVKPARFVIASARSLLDHSDGVHACSGSTCRPGWRALHVMPACAHPSSPSAACPGRSTGHHGLAARLRP